MTPLTDRSQAKESGFAQVRAALQKFEGTVTSAEFGQWGGTLVDDNGKPVPPKEFLEVETTEVEVLEVTEELAMSIDEWNFRVNCSDFEGSFWVESFLESADKFKIQIPDELVGKRIVFEKVTLESFDKKGNPTPKFNATNFVIAGVKKTAQAAPKVVVKNPAPAVEEVEVEPDVGSGAIDPMEAALTLAVGKTEAQFRTAISLDPQFVGNPLLPLAKAGAITTALVNEGKLIVVKEGNKDIYKLPE